MAIVVEETSETGERLAWATIEDVSRITGKAEDSITDEDVQRAQFIIDMVSGRTLDTYDLLNIENRKRDLYWLKLATAYQTVWMMNRPDMFTAWDIKNVSQDGINSDLVAGAGTLAPLAKRAIRRLSWKGTRSIQIGVRGYDDEDGVPAPGSPVYDEPTDVWEPMY